MADRKEKIFSFKKTIWHHYRKHGRVFPWRQTRNPYRILVSEIMLQQTQTARVLPKYVLFLKRFPDFFALAKTPNVELLNTWQGLGYNRRAIFLKKLSKIVTEKYGGRLPRNAKELTALPGVGPATAGAVAMFAFGEPSVFIETNIRRVFIHFFFGQKRAVADNEILTLVEKTMSRRNPREWFYALMDYGAFLKKGNLNPNRQSHHYRRQSRFQGSRRQLRGNIVKALLTEGPRTVRELAKEFLKPAQEVAGALALLKKDSLVRMTGGRAWIAR